MAFADPEGVAAILSAVEESAREAAAQPGAVGAMGRSEAAFRELTVWLIAERERGTAFEDMAKAAGHIAGSFLASVTMSIAREGAELDVFAVMLTTAASAGKGSLEDGPRHRAVMHEGRRQ